MNGDDLSHRDGIFGSGSGDAAQRRPEIRCRVVLLSEFPKLDAESELDRVMPRVLSDVVDRVNIALDETLPGAGARFLVNGRQVRFEVEAPVVLDLLPESVAVDLNCKLAVLAPAAEFQGAHLGSAAPDLRWH